MTQEHERELQDLVAALSVQVKVLAWYSGTDQANKDQIQQQNDYLTLTLADTDAKTLQRSIDRHTRGRHRKKVEREKIKKKKRMNRALAEGGKRIDQ